MDLNSSGTYVPSSITSWLPRGAMDLNRIMVADDRHRICWLPRGAMDLNGRGTRKSGSLEGVGSLVEPWI